MTESISAFIEMRFKDSPPIFKFDNSVLWHVFSLNADMEQETEKNIPAVQTLIHTSQVCSIWRDLALASPSLWGRVLNFKFFSRRGGQWRTEMFRRTGTALLHIKASDHEIQSMDVIDFFISVLSEHWARVKSLDIEIDYRRGVNRYRQLFERPAPSLTAFSSSGADRQLIAPDFVLFGNEAPLLRSISAPDMTQNLATLRAPNLRNLVLHPSISGSDLVHALSHMPLLESLEAFIRSGNPLLRDGKIPSSLPPVNLPRLNDINFKIFQEVDAALSILMHIIPANGCTLDFNGWYKADIPDNQSIALYDVILSTYLRYNAELSTTTNLSATFRGHCSSLRINLPSHRKFEFVVLNNKGFPQHMISTFLHSFTSFRTLDNITVLVLFLEPIEQILSNEDLKNFIRALVSVETLETDPLTLHCIQEIQSGSVESFLAIPVLKSIRLGFISKSEIVLVVDYLKSRVAIGATGDTLNVTLGGGTEADITPLTSIPWITVERVKRF